MTQPKVPYNELSRTYNDRYRQNDLPEIREKLLEICSGKIPKCVLEVGCGTGHWLAEIESAGGKIFGADYSTGMLKIAADAVEKSNLVNADANSLPFKVESFDIIFCVNAIHQFTDKQHFIGSAAELLRTGGILAVFGIDHDDPELIWYIYDYFETTKQIDRERFPSLKQMKEWMLHSGFSDIRLEKIQNIHTVKYGREILNDHFITKAGASQLALLSDDEYQSGLSKIEKEINSAPTGEIRFETNLNMFLLSGIKTP